MTTDVVIEQSRISYVDLPAIIGGAFLALAISLVLFNFGNAIGMSVSDEYDWERTDAWIGIVAFGLWGLWVQILASMTGGYLAGRMRRPVAGSASHEREIRDGAHGVLVWALSTVAVAIAAGLVTAFATLVVLQPDVDVVEKSQALLDREHNATVISAFVTAATSLVAAVASWWAATKGGEHRDNAVDHSHYVSFNKR